MIGQRVDLKIFLPQKMNCKENTLYDEVRVFQKKLKRLRKEKYSLGKGILWLLERAVATLYKALAISKVTLK